MKKFLLAVAATFGIFINQVWAADTVKIALITSLTGPVGSLGRHIKDGADLAIELLGKKIGGVPIEIFYGDDQGKPDVGQQIANEMIKKNKVDFITGVTLSNVLMAIYPSAVQSQTIMIGGQAGPSQIAGAECSPYFFSVGIENQTMSEAMGSQMTNEKLNDVYLMTPNYAGGKDSMTGFKRYFKGKVADEVYTPLTQTDFQAELSRLRAANPKAVYVFYPGGLGIQFVKQYAQSGLRGKIPLYTIAMNETILPALGDTAEGNFDVANWTPYLDNMPNKHFVTEFRKKYGYEPSEYAAVSYDIINLLDGAVKAVNGKVEDKNEVIAALEKADFKSVRGSFKFNTNHFPIQNWYLTQITKASDGKYFRKPIKTIFTDHKDSFYQECKMK